MRYESYVLNLIGIFLLGWGLVAIGNSVYLGEPYFILWFCYVGLVAGGLGILFRNGSVLAAQIVILGIPLIVWSFDFLFYVFTGNFIVGVSDYFFQGDRTSLANFISLQHLFTVPLGLFALWKIKFERGRFFYVVFGELIVVFFLSRVFTPVGENVNCVFESCIPLTFTIPYFLSWFLVYSLIILSTYFILLWSGLFEKK